MDFPKIPDLDGGLDNNIIFTLLPGLVSYKIVQVLTNPSHKVEATEAVVTGLAYTLISHLMWNILKWPGSLIPTPEPIGIMLCSITVGLAVSWGVSSDWVFKILRWTQITRRPSTDSIWQASIDYGHRKYGGFAIVTFDDGRRLYGRIRAVSSDQESGHIFLTSARWIHHKTDDPIEPGAFLVSLNKVEYLHLIPQQGEKHSATQTKGD
jgi:hypothetical protein